MDTTSTEILLNPTIVYVGALEDLGVGNKEHGIPSELAETDEAERRAYGENVAKSLREVTDLCHYGCIDGRVCMHNADGSKPETRLRQVGGTGLIVEVALNSGASILDTVRDIDNLGDVVDTLDRFYQATTGVRRSAHLGGCGGVNGAVSDQEAIATNPAIMAAVEAIMSIPAVIEYTGIDFDASDAAHVSARAVQTAEWMKQHGWNGQSYVEGVMKDEPAGVEDLVVEDDEFSGHKEPAVVFVLNTGEKKYAPSDEAMIEAGITPPFVVNIDASVQMARALGGQQGATGVRQALIANLAKHVAVADRLPSSKTPVFFIAA